MISASILGTNNLGNFFNNQVWTVIVLAIVLLFLYVIVLSYFVFKNFVLSRRIFGGMNREDLRSLLSVQLKETGSLRTELKEVNNEIDKILKGNLNHLSRVGLVRFNPFEDTGSDQSFSLVLLDEENNGYVVSSLHGRDRSRLYCKPVVKGAEGDYPFSKEEKEAIAKAQIKHE